MNNFWKSTVVFVLLIGFLVATLVCCCVTHMAQASMIQTKNKSVCCHASPNDREQHNTKKCETCLKNNLSAGTLTIFNVVPPKAVKSVPMDSVSFVLSVGLPLRLVDFHGPPKSLSDLPFYLKVHNLRI